jgi:hypothetical protein
VQGDVPEAPAGTMTKKTYENTERDKYFVKIRDGRPPAVMRFVRRRICHAVQRALPVCVGPPCHQAAYVH